jgi:Post-segregation antitoxin CcdA.
MKVHVNISLDSEVYRKHRAAGHNISKLCNTFLENYAVEPAKVKQKAIANVSETIKALYSQQKQEDKDKKLRGLLLQAIKFRATNEIKCRETLKKICHDYNLEWFEAVRRMEQIR